MKVIDLNIERTSFLIQSGPDINPVPPDAFYVELMPSGWFKVANISSKPYGGALVAFKRPVPALQGTVLPFLRLQMNVRVSADDLPNLARFENDVKVCIKSAPNPTTEIPNIVDGSTQLNLSTGEWQIDSAAVPPAAPTWIDTGFKPVLVPDVIFPIATDYHIDYSGGKFSVLGTKWAGQQFSVPSSLQSVPFLASNWQEVAAIQFQIESFLGCVVVYYKDVTLVWSEEAF